MKEVCEGAGMVKDPQNMCRNRGTKDLKGHRGQGAGMNYDVHAKKNFFFFWITIFCPGLMSC